MRSTRLISTIAIFCLLPLLCFAGSDKSPRTIADLPPDAQKSILAALGSVAGTAHAAGQRQDLPRLPEIRPWAQLAKLSSSNPNPLYVGQSVAIAGDTVVVGAQYGDYAAVFVKPADGWVNMTEVATLTASDATGCDLFGTSVSMSGDTIVVGAPENYCDVGPGAAYVFVKPPGGWRGTLTQTAKLTASDGAANDALGTSVSVDGETVVAGAPGTYATNNSGAAYVFVEGKNGWENMTQTAKLTASDGVAGNVFGEAVSVSGGAVVAGAPYAVVGGNSFQGAAYIFSEPPGGWSNATQTAKLTASDGAKSDWMGFSVSISASAVAVGAPNANIGGNQGQGAAYVFVEPTSGWVNMTQTAKLTAFGGYQGDSLGSSIAIRGDRVIAGAPNYSNANNPFLSGFFHEGAAYMFLKPAAGWANGNQDTKMTGSDARFGAYLGTSVALSGHLTVAGALFNNRTFGAAYIFVGP
jgi:hypothetical protein